MEQNNLSNSYLNYLDVASQGSGSQLMDDPVSIINSVFGNINLNSALAPVVLLSDFSKKGFVFVHKSCKSVTGFSSKYFTDAGLESFLEKIHEDDFEKINGEIFLENFKVLQEINPQEMYNYIFSHSYRLKNKEGKYSTILQRFSYLLSPQNKPLGAIGYLTDITMCSNGRQMVHRIEHVNKGQTQNSKEIIHEQHFYHDPEDKMISKREMEVLKWISEGLSSKQVAAKLMISVNTVNNHRKKMLQKTSCTNTPSLLRYVALQRVL